MHIILRMIRIPNLLIIAFTFLIIRYLVFIPYYSAYSLKPGVEDFEYMALIILTLLIAASGYVSNDYFDVVTDQINKPGKHYIGKFISPGQTFATALFLSIIALIGTVWLSFELQSWLTFLLLSLALAVAWWYAVYLKKTFLLGNLSVSFMSAGTIVMAWLIERQNIDLPDSALYQISGIVAAISIFAFLLTLLREIVKDVEDIEGDRLILCKSLPIVKGVVYTKKVLWLISILTLLLLLVTQFFLFQYSRTTAIVWLAVAVELPLVYFVILLAKAESKYDFHKLSSLLKWIMVAGMGTLIAGQF